MLNLIPTWQFGNKISYPLLAFLRPQVMYNTGVGMGHRGKTLIYGSNWQNCVEGIEELYVYVHLDEVISKE